MSLQEWVSRYNAAHGGEGAISFLSRKANLSYTTVLDAVKGRIVNIKRDTARKLSEATDGEVTVAEIRDPADAEDDGAELAS